MISKLLQGNRKALAKIRMFIDRPRQVDLIRYAKKILKRYDQQPRRRTREKIRHCRKVCSLDAALSQRLVQGMESAMPLLARLAGVDAECPLDSEVAVVPPTGKGRNVVCSERHQRVLSVIVRSGKSAVPAALKQHDLI